MHIRNDCVMGDIDYTPLVLVKDCDCRFFATLSQNGKDNKIINLVRNTESPVLEIIQFEKLSTDKECDDVTDEIFPVVQVFMEGRYGEVIEEIEECGDSFVFYEDESDWMKMFLVLMDEGEYSWADELYNTISNRIIKQRIVKQNMYSDNKYLLN